MKEARTKAESVEKEAQKLMDDALLEAAEAQRHAEAMNAKKASTPKAVRDQAATRAAKAMDAVAKVRPRHLVSVG